MIDNRNKLQVFHEYLLEYIKLYALHLEITKIL